MDHEKNYYEILDVASTADQNQIYQGYLRQRNAYAQDNIAVYSLMTKNDSERQVQQIQEAFDIIGNPEKRKIYDQARGYNNHWYLKETSMVTPTKESNNQSISKLISVKKYELNFKVDESFEKEIESTIDFTGEILKKIRTYKNLDLNRLSDMTKISSTYLKNIEEENFSGLPAPAYVRGFVFQYAKCLKLNPQMVSSSYIKRMST
ncbi:MAG: helix-turn-helix domain-containing protein [Bacteriovoracales bacterium]